MHGQRVLGAHVDDAFGGAHHVAADDHAFEQRVRIAFDLVAVHVRAGVAFVGVADDVLLRRATALRRNSHFRPVRKPAPPRPRSLAALICSITISGLASISTLYKRLVAADGDVLFDIVGADEAAVAQHDLLLRFEERHVLPGGNLGKARAVVDVRGQVVPLLDLAERQVLREGAGGEVVENAGDVAGLHAAQNHQRAARQAHVDQRFLRAEAEAADRGQVHVAALLVDGFGEGVVDALGAVAGAAGAHAHADARPRGQQFGHAGFAHRVEGADILDAGHALLLPFEVLHLAVQGLLVHVAEDGMIHLHHGSQRALAEAGHGAQRIAAVRRGDAELVGAVLALLRQPQFQAQALQQVARSARVAGGAAADADGVIALRLQVEQRVEGDHAVDLRQRDIGFLGDVFQDLRRKVFVRMMFLDALQDAEQRAGPAFACGDGAVREALLFRRHYASGDPYFRSIYP